MYFCGYFVLSNGPNWEDFSIITIFGDHFRLKFGFLTPGVPIYRVPLNSNAIYIEDIAGLP